MNFKNRFFCMSPFYLRNVQKHITVNFLILVSLFILSTCSIYSCLKDYDSNLSGRNALTYRESNSRSIHYFEPNENDDPTIIGQKITKNPFGYTR